MKKVLLTTLILVLSLTFVSCEKVTLTSPEISDVNNTDSGITSEEKTTDASKESVKINGDKIEAPAYNLEIPKGFEVKSSDDDVLLENKKGTIQFNIMDKTEVAEDYDQYIQKTYDASKSAGITVGEIEDVTISGIAMKRFSMNLTQDDEELESYVYFAQTGGRVLMITLTSKDGGLEDVNAADEYVAQIDF